MKSAIVPRDTIPRVEESKTGALSESTHLASRRRFVKQLALVTTGVAIPSEILTACAGSATRVAAAARPDLSGWDLVPGILQRIIPPRFPQRDFDTRTYGAVGDGISDCTDSFHRAVEACARAGGGRVVVPPGRFLTGPVHLQSGVDLHLEKGATVAFSQDPGRYLPAVLTRFEGVEYFGYSPLVYALDCTNVAVTGEGTLDGQADNEHWWPWKGNAQFGWTQGRPRQNDARQRLFEMAERGVPVPLRVFGGGDNLRPQFIQLYRCRNVLIEGVTLVNSPMWEIHPVLCTNVTVRGVTVSTLGPNNDGCDPESCRDVLIENCSFHTGDDCIAIKSGRNADGRRIGVPSENIVVRGCQMRDGHGGVTIGSEISGGVRNVFAERCRMDSPHLATALRLKNNAARGGTLEHIYMRDVTVGEVADAVLTIDFLYEEGSKGAFVPIARDIEMLRVTSRRSDYAIYARGIETSTIDDIRLIDCTFDNVRHPNVVERVTNLQLRNTRINGVEETWALRFANAVIARNPQVHPKWDYTAGVVLLAIQRVGDSRRDAGLLSYVKSNIDRMVAPDGSISGYKASDFNLDQIAEGRVMFSLLPTSEKRNGEEGRGKGEGGDARYLKAIELLRDQLRSQPRTNDGGFWHKKIYPQQMWLDGLYMAGPFYAEYGATFGEPAAFDDVARQFMLAARHTRDPRTGLLYHAWDSTRSQPWADLATGTSRIFWGRAIGWYLMGAIDALDYLPEHHRDRPELISIVRDVVAAVARVQDPATGLWWQVLDQPHRRGNYLEASASSMFVYALGKGARLGYLEKRYRDVAERGFAGLVSNLVKTGDDGRASLTGICQVAGLGGAPRKDGSTRDGSYEYYVSEPVVADDYKGVGPFIMAALELAR